MSITILSSLCLYCSDGNNADDILSKAASGQIVYRERQTLKHGAVSAGLCKSLNQLVSDISSFQGREYQGVGMSCNRASGSLGSTYAGNESCVKLKLAVQSQIRELLLCDLNSLGNLGHIVVLCAAL